MALQSGIPQGTGWRTHPQGGLLASHRGAVCWRETSVSLHVVLSIGLECPKGMAAGFLQGKNSKIKAEGLWLLWLSLRSQRPSPLPSSIGQTDHPWLNVGRIPQRGKLKRKGSPLAIWEAAYHRCLIRASNLNVQIKPNLSRAVPPQSSLSQVMAKHSPSCLGQNMWSHLGRDFSPLIPHPHLVWSAS